MSLSSSSVSCSICLEYVTDVGERSWAKLTCGHEFHLDCIGSAFNAKGAMQCPNCRKTEEGQWLYASGCRSFKDFMEDWPHGEDIYDLSYPEMFGIQWHPVPAFSHFPSFEEEQFQSIPFQDLLGQHAGFAEHTAVPSSTHQCPYVAYYGPVHSSSSNSAVNASDGPYGSYQWGGPPGPGELHYSYAFPALENQDHGWERHSMPSSATSSRLGGSDQRSTPSVNQRPSRSNIDLSRSGSFLHHGSGGSVGTSVTSFMVPPYPSSATRARDRVQALQAYSQPRSTSPPMPLRYGSRRSNYRGESQVCPLPSSSDQTGGFYPEAESRRRSHGWEREHLVPTTVGRSNSFEQVHGPEQSPFQSWS